MRLIDTPLKKNRLAAEVREGWDLTLKELPEEENLSVRILEERDIAWLYRREPGGNKGTFGKVLAVAGSEGMGGAAFFSAAAALRTGVGMVKIQTQKENRVPLQTLLPEAMLDCTPVCGEEAPSSWEQDLAWCDVLVVGPGLGTGREAALRVRWFLEGALREKKPLVLDADGLNLLAMNPQWRKLLPPVTVLTPHMGEMSRLTGRTISELKERPFGAAAALSEELGCICVLKDALTVIAGPGQVPVLNLRGCDGMATAGSGDVLSGIIVGALCLGRNLPEKKRNQTLQAACGVFLHGLSGEQAARMRGRNAMTARDLLEGISLAELAFRAGEKTGPEGA